MRRGLWAVASWLLLSGCQHLATEAETPALPLPPLPVAEAQVLASSTPETTGATETALAAETLVAETQVAASTSAEPALEPEPATPAVTDLWERIRAGLKFETVENDDVLTQRAWFERNQEYMNRVSQRAGRYMHHIVERIEARGLPLDLALLPIVESAFHPYAYSRSRASGIWQFMPKTGKGYGMDQNWWQDGRRDVIRSTDAALDYLTRLHNMFDGDWLLALAAYNAGEGNILRAVKKNQRAGKPADFWSLKLRKETSAYVPKMLALAQLLREQDRFALRFQPIANEPYFARVNIEGQIDLALAAELAGTSEDELYQLNPHFNRWATDPKGPHELLVPVANAVQFEQALQRTPLDERVKWATYTIKNGDSLGKIAKQFRTSIELLRSTNKIRGNTIRAGQQLLIPKAGGQSPGAGTLVASLSPRQKAELNRIASQRETASEYQVQAGDTLWAISRRHNMKLDELMALNALHSKSALRPGQVIKISGDKTAASHSSSTGNNPNLTNRKIRYTVRSGDSLARIAQRFGVKVADLGRWNNWPLNRLLQPGQKLTVYADLAQVNGG